MVSMATRVLSGPGVRSQFAELVAPLTPPSLGVPIDIAHGDHDPQLSVKHALRGGVEGNECSGIMDGALLVRNTSEDQARHSL
jgi:hypothetical protein